MRCEVRVLKSGVSPLLALAVCMHNVSSAADPLRCRNDSRPRSPSNQTLRGGSWLPRWHLRKPAVGLQAESTRWVTQKDLWGARAEIGFSRAEILGRLIASNCIRNHGLAGNRVRCVIVLIRIQPYLVPNGGGPPVVARSLAPTHA